MRIYNRKMDNQDDDGCRLFFGSSVFPELGLVLHTLGKSSSVELPLDHVDRDVKKVACEDHGDSEGVAIV